MCYWGFMLGHDGNYFGYPPEECTAELMEVDGGELVVIKAPDGQPLVFMPVDQWEAIREFAKAAG